MEDLGLHLVPADPFIKCFAQRHTYLGARVPSPQETWVAMAGRRQVMPPPADFSLIKRFAQRHTYLGMSAIAVRDLGFAMTDGQQVILHPAESSPH